MSEEVCKTVDRPSGIQDNGVAQKRRNTEGIDPSFVPEVDWDDSWNDEADQWHQFHIVSVVILKFI